MSAKPTSRRLSIAALTAVAATALVLGALTATPARAKPRGSNGQIVFGRYDPSLDDNITYTINPDGSHEQQVIPEGLGIPHWAPDGTRIANGSPAGDDQIVNPDDGSVQVVANPDPANLFLPCNIWSPDGARLACEGFGLSDPSRNGIYTVSSSGGDLTRMTSNPGGDDNPGDYSPDGKRFVFIRSAAADGNVIGLFVVKVDGTGLRQITPTGTRVNEEPDWSPQGNEIIFSQNVTPSVRSSIWVVHADGTGLHEIHIQAQPACGGAYSDPTSQGCYMPRWSPDGRKIVFSRGTSDHTNSNVYTVNADGSGLTQVTHGGGGNVFPDWGTHPLAK